VDEGDEPDEREAPQKPELIQQALCTEAALNAIQRRYPQIYKSSDRYLLDTGSIRVQAKDFLMSVKSESDPDLLSLARMNRSGPSPRSSAEGGPR
jgi:hypothetical protein